MNNTARQLETCTNDETSSKSYFFFIMGISSCLLIAQVHTKLTWNQESSSAMASLPVDKFEENKTKNLSITQPVVGLAISSSSESESWTSKTPLTCLQEYQNSKYSGKKHASHVYKTYLFISMQGWSNMMPTRWAHLRYIVHQHILNTRL